MRLSLTLPLLCGGGLTNINQVIPALSISSFSDFLGGAALNTLQLADLRPGTSAIVTAICGASRIASRLMEMGFVPGAVVEVLRRAPFGGPMQYRVHGVSISMRPSAADCVFVEKEQESRQSAARPAAERLELATR